MMTVSIPGLAWAGVLWCGLVWSGTSGNDSDGAAPAPAAGAYMGARPAPAAPRCPSRVCPAVDALPHCAGQSSAAHP